MKVTFDTNIFGAIASPDDSNYDDVDIFKKLADAIENMGTHPTFFSILC